MVATSRAQGIAEALLLPVFALTAALLLFGVFVWLGGTDPVEAWKLLFLGAFGDDIETNIELRCEEYLWEQQSSSILAH